jgi:hypothetical protein
MQKQKKWVKPTVKVYTKNDIFGKENADFTENESASSKTGS